MSKSFDFFKSYIESTSNDSIRVEQAQILDNLISDNFPFDSIECIETGCVSGHYDNFGIYLSKLTQDTNGKFSTVDISEDYIQKSINIFNEVIGKNNNEYVCSDSVKFLESYEGTPNVVHLDSYDLDILNPLPSMLHHWLEFQAIKDKMPSGSILMIDDNFFKGTVIYWHILFNGELKEVKEVYVDYDILGKGSMIYHYVKQRDCDWELVGDHYRAGPNLKLFFRKK